MKINDTRYIAGAWNVICDRCGFKYKNFELRKEWNGLYTCHGGGTNNCWEPRNQQDFVKGRRDQQSNPWNRPEGTDVFTTSEEDITDMAAAAITDMAGVTIEDMR